MRVIYRISDTGYNKVKPGYINNEVCLANAIKEFGNAKWSIIADNVSKETDEKVHKILSRLDINDRNLRYIEEVIIIIIELDKDSISTNEIVKKSAGSKKTILKYLEILKKKGIIIKGGTKRKPLWTLHEKFR